MNRQEHIHNKMPPPNGWWRTALGLLLMLVALAVAIWGLAGCVPQSNKIQAAPIAATDRASVETMTEVNSGALVAKVESLLKLNIESLMKEVALKIQTWVNAAVQASVEANIAGAQSKGGNVGGNVYGISIPVNASTASGTALFLFLVAVVIFILFRKVTFLRSLFTVTARAIEAEGKKGNGSTEAVQNIKQAVKEAVQAAPNLDDVKVNKELEKAGVK